MCRFVLCKSVWQYAHQFDNLENRVFKIYDYQHGLHQSEDLAQKVFIMDLKDAFDRIKIDHRD